MNKEMFVGMPGAKRWRAMMNREPGAGRYVHISCQATMVNGKPRISRGVTYMRPETVARLVNLRRFAA